MNVHRKLQEVVVVQPLAPKNVGAHWRYPSLELSAGNGAVHGMTLRLNA